MENSGDEIFFFDVLYPVYTASTGRRFVDIDVLFAFIGFCLWQSNEKKKSHQA
jgi:hypothetical protein